MAGASGGPLGCGDNMAFIRNKCTIDVDGNSRGGTRFCDLQGATRIYYDRRLDDISEAEVELALGDITPDCCECIGDIWPLCHELVIVRDDEVVWQGPVTEVVQGQENVTIRAKDKLVWMTLRVLAAPLLFQNTVANGTQLTDIAQSLLLSSLNDDDAGCFADCIINNGDGLPASFNRDRVFLPFDGSIFDLFQSLAESGVDYTVVRNCLILGGEPSAELPPVSILQDEHLLGDVQIVKSVNDYGNRFYVRYDGDTDLATCQANGNVINGTTITPCPVVADSESTDCFGRVERIINTVSGLPSPGDSAKVTANIYASQGSTPPLRIDFPPGTQLSPDTPWGINDMIPGQQVRVGLSNFCTVVNQQFILQKVSVDVGPDGEKVAIDLGPINKFAAAS